MAVEYVIQTVFEAVTGSALAGAERVGDAYRGTGAAVAAARGEVGGLGSDLAVAAARGEAGLGDVAASANLAALALGEMGTANVDEPLVSAADAAAAAIDGVGESGEAALRALGDSARVASGDIAEVGGAAQGGMATVVSAAATARGGVAGLGVAGASALGGVTAGAGAAAAALGGVGEAGGAAGEEAAEGVDRIPPALDGAGDAARRFEGTGRGAMDRVGMSVGGVVSRVAALAAGWFGLSKMMGVARGALGDRIGMENAELGMAAQISRTFDLGNLTGGERFAESMALSRDYMGELARRAASLPGSVSEFVSISGSIAGPLFVAGMGLDDLLEKTGDLARFSALLPDINRADIGRQVATMLQGRAQMDMALPAMMVSQQLLPMGLEEFNALSKSNQREAAEVLFAAIGGLVSTEEVMAAVEGLTETRLSTLQEALTGITGVVGKVAEIVVGPLGEGAVRLTGYLERNEGRLNRVAAVIGGGVVAGLERGVNLAMYLGDNMDRVLATVLAIGGGLAAWKVAGLAGGLGVLGSVAGAAVPGVGVALGGGALTAALAGGVTSLFAPIAGMLTGGLGGILPMVAAAGVAAWPVIAALGVLGVVAGVVAGAAHVVTRNLMGLGSFFRGGMGTLGGELMRAGGVLVGVLMSVGVPLGTVIVPILGGLAYVLGLVVRVFTDVVNNLGASVAGLAAFLGAIIANPLDWRGAMRIAEDKMLAFDFARLFSAPATGLGDTGEVERDAGRNLGDARPTQDNSTYIQNMVIEQRFEGDVSPDRIAFGVFEELDRLRSRRGTLRPSQAF